MMINFCWKALEEKTGSRDLLKLASFRKCFELLGENVMTSGSYEFYSIDTSIADTGLL
jgi:hypothetical protein